MEFDPTFTTGHLISAVSMVISIAVGIYAWFGTRRADVDERFKAGSDRMDRHDQRLVKVEQTIQQMPSKTDLHQIELGLERMNGSMGRVEAVLEGNQQIMTRLETVVTRHEEHLLNK